MFVVELQSVWSLVAVIVGIAIAFVSAAWIVRKAISDAQINTGNAMTKAIADAQSNTDKAMNKAIADAQVNTDRAMNKAIAEDGGCVSAAALWEKC